MSSCDDHGEGFHQQMGWTGFFFFFHHHDHTTITFSNNTKPYNEIVLFWCRSLWHSFREGGGKALIKIIKLCRLQDFFTFVCHCALRKCVITSREHGSRVCSERNWEACAFVVSLFSQYCNNIRRCRSDPEDPNSIARWCPLPSHDKSWMLCSRAPFKTGYSSMLLTTTAHKWKTPMHRMTLHESLPKPYKASKLLFTLLIAP